MKMEELKDFLAYPDTKVVDALQKIDKNAKGILFIINEEEKLVGTITDGDVRRWLIKTGDLQAPVERVMNKNPKYIYSNNITNYREYLLKYSIRIAPVVTPDNTVCDMVMLDREYRGEIKQRDGLKDVEIGRAHV